MKGMMISFGAWFGLLQLPAPSPISMADMAQLVGVALGLASLTVLVYRFGVWRQEIHNTKHDVAGEIARYREESNRNFARLEQRLDVFDRAVTAAQEYRLASERWQGRVETRLEGHDKEIAGVADRIGRLEGDVAA
jgi:hypothetical protein